MAEIVEYRHERMLPEYEQMLRWKLFSNEEIKKIIKIRQSFEYKLGRQSKSIKDFCEYIAYERNLLSMIDERCQSMGLSKNNVETSISHHIKNLYKQTLSKFPQEQRIWFNYVKFCKYAKFVLEGTTAFDKMLQYHSDKPAVWLRAAMWEYHETLNMEKVKELLLRGLQRHPDNRELYIKFFNIMLNEAAKMSSALILNNKTESEQSLGLERVVVVYENSKTKIQDIEFLVELLNIATEFTFTQSLQKLLLEDMMKLYPRNEILWDTLAQRELKGHHMSDLKKSEDDNVNTNVMSMESIEESSVINEIDKKPQMKTLKRRIELAVEIYETGARELKTKKMWAFFITAMLELNQDMSTQQDLKRKMLGSVFKGAYEANCMSECHYFQYIELLMQSKAEDDFISEVIQKATIEYSSSVKLWELWMRFYIRKNDEQKTYEIFRKAIKKLAFEAYPLWRLLIQFYQINSDMGGNKVDEIYKEATNQNSAVFEPFKADYIEWVALTKSVRAARKIYTELVKIPPPCLELHQKMASIEAVQITPDIKAWRQCHDNATFYFGKQRTDVWINYIKFERDSGDPKNMSLIFERAKATLNEDLVDNLISEHNFLTTGIF